MFTTDNTEGFSDAEIKLMNEALAVRMARGESEKGASDAINNAWCDGAELADLVAA